MRTAVTVETRDYVNNHGANPRGRGFWLFCTVDPRRLDYLSHLISVNGTYGEAKREAKRQAADRGLSTIYVCA